MLVCVQKVVQDFANMLTLLYSFRITTFADFVKVVGKPYMWVQRICGLDFLPEELHVWQMLYGLIILLCSTTILDWLGLIATKRALRLINCLKN